MAETPIRAPAPAQAGAERPALSLAKASDGDTLSP